MKKLLIAAAVAGLVSTANAQSAFEGAYGQLGIGYQSTSPSTSNNLNFSTNSGLASSIGIGYNFAIDKNYLLGIGADYNPIASSNANYGDPADNGKYKTQNTYNIFLTPGIAIDKNSLAYAKVGYTGTTMKFTDNTGDSSYNLNGYSLGLGYKQIIDGGLYGFAEGNYLSYNNKDVGDGIKLKQNTFNLMVGVGYKF